MHATKHRKVGGPLMLAVPPKFLDDLPLPAGTPVGFTLDGTKLMGEATSQIRYCLDDLLAQSDYRDGASQEERDWLDAPSVAGELL
jgi:antitoxin ChpS